MIRRRRVPRWAALLVACALGGVGLPEVAHAQILWTDWTSITVGNVGTASGTIAAPSGPVGVTYNGGAYRSLINGNYWSPSAAPQYWATTTCP